MVKKYAATFIGIFSLKKLSFFILFLLVLILIKPSSISAAPPENFETIQLLGTGLNNPTAIEFAPDGRLFILEQSGAIKIYKNGQLLPRFFDELPALADSDRGLLGIAFDPDFNTNHYVYFYYIDLESKHNVVRFDASEDIGRNGPVTIWKSNVVTGSNHAGGGLQFGPDGKLYIGIGDGNNPSNSQSLTSPFGKIMRINKDGTIPADNPFNMSSSNLGEIWAYGLRNPFRFQFDKVTGDLLVGDVGGEKWEEVNRVIKGGNYGWPTAEGDCTPCSFINPIYAYPHPTPSYSITGGFIYRGTLFPSEYRGNYFFGDNARGFLRRLTMDSSGNPTGDYDFDLNAGTVVDLKMAPDGSIYYLTIFPGKLFKINYTLGNKTPIVKAASNIKSGVEPLTVQFSSAGSSDPEGQSLTYLWEFGDGTTSTESNPTKNYSAVGKYNVFLTVSDGQLSAKSSPIEISVGTPPTVEFVAPAASSTFRAGDTINYSIEAKDKNGNELPENLVTFEVIFHHDIHIHPFLRPINSKSGSFIIPRTGETSPDIWYELRATATDSNNLTATKSINIYPQKTKITFITNPQNSKINIDGTPYSTPIIIEGVVGSQREIDAPTQKIEDNYFEFDTWSDGGAKKHTITLPQNQTTYTATFKPSPSYLGKYFDNPNFSGTPVFTREDPIINFSWGAGSPDPRIPNDMFSVRWEKKQFFPFGRYKFSGFSDDGIRAYLDGQLILDAWSFNRGVSSVKDVPEGFHDIRVDYREEGGGAGVGFSWDLTPDQPTPTTPTPTPTLTPTPTSTPTQGVTPTPTPTAVPTPSPDKYNAEYFSNKNLTGSPEVTRYEDKIKFIWNNLSPDPNIPNDQFSARYTKTENFTAGIYRFIVRADDGVRIYVDGQKILDGWVDQKATTYSVDKYLTAGSHTLKIEYYEAFGGAIMEFDYQLVPDLFKGEYFDNKDLSGSPALTRQDAKINFTWNGSITPDPKIPPDRFSVRWTKKQYFKNKTYSFTLKSDDGIRFWIDNNLVVDDWTNHSMKTYTPNLLLTEGIHSLKIEYFENTGGAVASYNQNN